jgi:hypothetical protein
MEGFVEP